MSENTGLPIEVVSAIKSHMFYTYHVLDTGFKRFDPSYEMVESWRRLSDKNKKSAIQPHDITMLKHELCEMQYILSKGCSYDEAHEYTSKRFNYSAESDAYYNRILKKH